MFLVRSCRNSGTLVNRSGAAVAALKAQAREWETVLTETVDGLVLQIWGCELRLVLDGSGARIDLSAPDRRLLGTLQDTATGILEDEGVEIQWDSVDEGALAPGLSLMRVVEVTQATGRFTRVRVAGGDAPRFGQGGLHFRLLIPPRGRAPVWPRVSANGRTVCPQGEDAPHRPVYTVADSGDDWVDFDIFRHNGSPTCDWTERTHPGDQVGLMGPGGGWCPDARRLWLFGDETALPAIARMLRLSRGKVRAFLRADPDDIGTLASDPRVLGCKDLLTALADADLDNGPDCHVWFAGHAMDARRARNHLTARGFDKPRFTAAAYWGQPEGHT